MKTVRFDVVGSFLRPEHLKKARADFEAGIMSKDEFNKIKNEAVKELVKKEKEAGLYYITDGEYNRTYWHLDFIWGLDGIGKKKEGGDLPFHDEIAKLGDIYLTGKIKAKPHPFVEDFKFLKTLENEGFEAKQTMPAPGYFLTMLVSADRIENTRKIYPTNDELIQDIAMAYRGVIKQLYDAGCRTVQFDDCSWGALCSDKGAERFKAIGGPEDIKGLILKTNNLAIEGKPLDLKINTHICRGNYHSTYISTGPYDGVASYVFAKENVNTLYLEYDDNRSGGFEPLSQVTPDKDVVLGLITSKRPELEDKATVIARIKEASKYVPLERLYLSSQCGFASCEIGNKLTEEQQWAKIKLIKEIAEEVWGKK